MHRPAQRRPVLSRHLGIWPCTWRTGDSSSLPSPVPSIRIVSFKAQSQTALARLHFLIESGRRGGLLLRQPGTGKSLLSCVLAQQAQRRGQVVVRYSVQGLDHVEFLTRLAACWGLDPVPGLSMTSLWRMLLDRMAENHWEKGDSIILLDDADEATAGVLAQAPSACAGRHCRTSGIDNRPHRSHRAGGPLGRPAARVGRLAHLFVAPGTPRARRHSSNMRGEPANQTRSSRPTPSRYWPNCCAAFLDTWHNWPIWH